MDRKIEVSGMWVTPETCEDDVVLLFPAGEVALVCVIVRELVVVVVVVMEWMALVEVPVPALVVVTSAPLSAEKASR